MDPNQASLSQTVLLELKDVEVDYVSGSHSARLLDQVNLSVHVDEIVAILGPSGSGKTSLMRVAAGLSRPGAGQVLFRGESITGPHPQIGVVFQTPALFPWMTTQQNIELGVENRHLDAEKKAAAVTWAIDRVGLEGHEEAYPRELSSGVKTRVGLARALAAQPELLCLDDPFSGLDVLNAENMRNELVSLWQNTDVNPKAILIVTHNIQEAVALASRVVILSGTPARMKVQVQNHLAYPRNPNSPEFQEMVSQIHTLITRDTMPDEGISVPGRFQQRLAPLPRAEFGQIIGLLEALDDSKGHFDVFDFVAETRKEYSSVLMVVNAAEMIEFVRTPKDHVEITELGRQFLRSDVNGRKILLNLQLQKLKLVNLVVEMLKRAHEHQVARELILEEFALLFPSENPARLLSTFIAWVRYAELMGYSARRGQLYLDRLFVMQDGAIQEIKSPKPSPRPKAPPTVTPSDEPPA
ncbi:MAG: nitrate/sulfonate/bicarbonate ABC transporter ATP-binding protein [candidate division FCPU426 bacterium]